MAAAGSIRAVVTAATLAAAAGAQATPVLGEPITAGPLRLFPDDADARLFYYPPGPLAVAQAADGGPDLRFLLLGYVGTPATGDEGAWVARAILSFRVTQQPVAAAALAAARATLPPGATLRAVPAGPLEAHLVWTPTDAGADAARDLGQASFEPVEGAAAADGGWTERQVLLTPGPSDAALLWGALQRGRLILSFGWAHHATGLARRPGRLVASPGVPTDGVPPEPPQTPVDQVVGSGAVEVAADATRWPDRFRRLDLNQAVPPGFAVLEIRCYDFQEGLRPDLERKLVEVRATTLTGRPALQAVRFGRRGPSPVATLRFPQAVRLDRPFAWRTVEVGQDGTVATAPWQERSDWIPIIDATSPPEARPAPAPAPQEPP